MNVAQTTNQKAGVEDGILLALVLSLLQHDRFATQVRKLVIESPSPVGAITSVDDTAGGALKELVKDLAQHGVELVFAHISESLKSDLNRHGLTEVIGPNRQFETLRECLAAYASRTR